MDKKCPLVLYMQLYNYNNECYNSKFMTGLLYNTNSITPDVLRLLILLENKITIVNLLVMLVKCILLMTKKQNLQLP